MAKKRREHEDVKEMLKEAGRKSRTQKYTLRLYVAGVTPRSQEAIRAVKAMCEEHLAGRYDLEVIDIYQQPTLAKDEQIVAAPTLILATPPAIVTLKLPLPCHPQPSPDGNGIV